MPRLIYFSHYIYIRLSAFRDVMKNYIRRIKNSAFTPLAHLAFSSALIAGAVCYGAPEQGADDQLDLQLTELLTGVTPEPQKVYLWNAERDPFSISSDTVIVIDENAEALVEQGAVLLQEDMESLYGLHVPVVRSSLSSEKTFLLSNAGEAWGQAETDLLTIVKVLLDEGGDESYRLVTLPSGAGITAPSSAGVFYGVQTLRQMLRNDGSIPSLAISDWPDQAIRASYGNPPGGDMEAYVRKLARLKMNMAIVESSWNSERNWWYNPTGENLERAKLFFKLCREYNIEPVPLVQGFGWSYGVVGINPHTSEGVWVQDERHTLQGEESSKLNNPNVLKTEAAPIIVTNEAGDVRYEEGKDYAIVPGVTVARFAVNNKPWEIVRINGGKISDGQVVRVDYNYMTYCNTQTPHCPSEPETYKIIDRTLENVIQIFEPNYIHIGHDEVRYINRCRRCQQSGLSSEELVSKEIHHWYDTIDRLDSSINVMMWADLLREDRAGEFILPSLPGDLIICPWAYRDDPVTLAYMAEQMDYFATEKGRRTLGASSGYSHRNIWAWKGLADELASDGNSLGFMFTYWGDGARFWSALSFAAEYMWSRNKVDEELFGLYESADLLSRNRGIGLTLGLADQRGNLAKYADLMLMMGENVQEDGAQLSAQMNDLATQIKARMIADLATSEVAKGTVPERILSQIAIIPAYYMAMGKYLEAQREELRGNREEAAKLLAALAEEFKMQRYPGYAAADKWLAQYHETEEFPSSTEIFGVEMERPLLIPVDGTTLQLASLGELVEQKNETSIVYDLETPRDVYGLEFMAEQTPNYSIKLSLDGEHFEPTDGTAITRSVDGQTQTMLVWPAQSARWVALQWDGETSDTPDAVGISVVKEPTEYLSIRKSGDKDWKVAQFWKDVPVAEGFVTREDGAIKISRWQTQAQAVFDDENLYVRFECPLADPAKLVVNAEEEKESATQIWENDCVQVFISPRETPKGEAADFHQVIVNSAGDYMLRRFNRTEHSVEIQTHADVMDDKWVVYMAIPLEWLEVEGKLEGQEWGVNFCRTKHDPYEHSSWAILPQGLMSWFLQPDYFGTIRFESAGINETTESTSE